MIPNKERWHYLTVTRLPPLSRGITSKHNGDFYYLNCVHSYRTKKLESHENVYKNKDCWDAVIPFGKSIIY